VSNSDCAENWILRKRLNRAERNEAIQSTEAKVKAGVESLFGLKGSAGASDVNTTDTMVESTFVSQRGCDITGKSSDDDNSSGNLAGLSTIPLVAAARMARRIQGAKHQGVRQTALLKHYR